MAGITHVILHQELIPSIESFDSLLRFE